MLKLYPDDAEDQDRLGVIAGYIAHETCGPRALASKATEGGGSSRFSPTSPFSSIESAMNSKRFATYLWTYATTTSG